MRNKLFMIILLGWLFYLAPAALADWSAAQRLTRNLGDSIFAAVAIDSANTIHVVWGDGTPGNTEIYYKRSSDAGAAWSAAQRITWTSGGSSLPAIAIDLSDTIHVVWMDDTPVNREIYYSKSTDGGNSWSSSQRITWTPESSHNPAIAADSSGTIHVVWHDYTPGNYEIYYKRSTDGGNSWGPSQRITWTSGFSYRPAIAVDSTDSLHVVWHNDIYMDEIYYKRSTDGGTTWSAAKRLTSNSGYSWVPAIAIYSSGNIHIVWQDETPGNYEIYYKRSEDGGTTWSPAQRITWTSGDSRNPAMAIDSGDTIHVAWDDDTPGASEVYYKNSADGGTTWSASQRLTWTSGTSNHPAMAIDSSDTLHLVWHDNTPGNNEIYYKKGN